MNCVPVYTARVGIFVGIRFEQTRNRKHSRGLAAMMWTTPSRQTANKNGPSRPVFISTRRQADITRIFWAAALALARASLPFASATAMRR